MARYIAVAGPIGVGKSLVAKLLAPKLDARLEPEVFSENLFLPRLYKPGGVERWGLACEMAFLLPRVDQLVDIDRCLKAGENVVTDWVWWQTPLFSRLTLPSDEFRVYVDIASRLVLTLPVPEAVILLSADFDVTRERIAKRSRPMEKQIDPEYLQRVHDSYRGWRETPPGDTNWLHLDTTSLDLANNPTDQAAVLSTIQTFLESKGLHKNGV